jgi:glycosyltransferase involved in cell wall biosynthesis
MNVLIFGTGPMPCEPQYPVMAPGARTWQIARTAATALAGNGDGSVTVIGLENETRTQPGAPMTFECTVPAPDSPTPPGSAQRKVSILYYALGFNDFMRLNQPAAMKQPLFNMQIDAVIGTSSIQPCATAALFAASRGIPFWADIFGDPVAEIQSRAQLLPEEKDANATQYHHVWKLMLPVLLQGDQFSALSNRQRFALIGQLGITGRLNHLTSGTDFVHAIPYGLFPDDPPPLMPHSQRDMFVLMWCGSFNTWMDVDSLVEGLVAAIKANSRLRLLVVGGKIPGYNEIAYERFQEGVRTAGVRDAVRMMDWQPLAETLKLYAFCDAGLNIDRYTYEAVLGSRTRIVNFLAAGKPVISTTVTELTEELAGHGFVVPFDVSDSTGLARAIEDAVIRRDELRQLGQRGAEYVRQRFDAVVVGQSLADWVRNPAFSPDKADRSRLDPANPLTQFWQRVQLKT